jgi:PKD repeat protein
MNTSPADPFNNTTYSWNFGTSISATANSANATYTYYYNGTYTVTLNLYNNVSGCSTSSTQIVSVTNAAGGMLPPCNSNFTYTLGATGEVSFTSLSTDTTYTGNSIYNWVFEPGEGSNSKNPTYTYAYNGVYSVSLNITDSVANCYSSTTQTLSITNTANPPCAPSVSFYMHKDSLNPLPGVWEISPYYSSQVSSAVWHWGDGTSTAGFFPTHTYSVAGQYNVCVTVYALCGDSSTTCQNDSLYRLVQNNSTNSVIQVTVISTTAGIKTNAQETAQVSVYPNPSAGLFTLQLSNVSATASKAQISITNILGEVIYSSQEQITNNALAKNIDMQSVPNGAYFMKVIIDDKTFTNKTIISK